MRAEIDGKTNKPVLILDQDDLIDAEEVRKLMKSKGYQVLIKYLTFVREAMIDKGKNGIKTRAQRDLSDVKWGVLFGWDECMAIPQRIVERAQKFLDSKEKENDATDADYGQTNE